MKEIKSVPGMSVIKLTPEQFQFTRALYVANSADLKDFSL